MDLNWLREIALAQGPFATVYLDASHHTPDAPQLIELSWRGLRAELASAGAPEDTLTALDPAVSDLAAATEHPHGPVGRVLVASGGSVLLNQQLPRPPDPPGARWSELPDLLPALAQLREPVNTMVAVVDSTGADLYHAAQAEHLDTARYPLHQVHGGGLSHLKMRHRVEESAKASASDVAKALDDRVADIGADLLVLAGETQSRARVRRSLGHRASLITEEVPVGGRAPGASAAELDRRLDQAVDLRAEQARRAELERYATVAGRADGQAVDGVVPVLEALRTAQVDALLLDVTSPPRAPLWIGPSPEQLGVDAEELVALGVRPKGPVDAADALLRAAAGTGARFYPTDRENPRPPSEGVGAVLRVGGS
jgi:release factor family 2